MIEGVTVAGDLLRPKGDGRPGGTDKPTLWLLDAVKRSIYLATGLATEALTATTNPVLHHWIEAQRSPTQADAFWAENHAHLPPGAAVEDLILARLRGRFCVGYEMPPWLVGLLDRNAVPYIDLRLHPIRFMDDLLFAARASRLDTQAALLSMAMQESEVIVTAGLREAMCRLISEARIPDNTVLVAGQRPFDSTQIVNGRFFDAEPLEADIRAICSRYAAVVLKPHPLDRQHSLLAVASRVLPDRLFGEVGDNIYRMMAMPQVSAILTVNSGVAQEAPYFGKRVHTLAPLSVRPAWRGDEAGRVSHASMDDVVLTPDFWRIVLAPYAQVTPADGMRLPPKPNRLRIALDSFWNFQQIDTDLIPHETATPPRS